MIRQVQKLGRLGGRVGEWCGRWWLCWRSRCRGVHLACYVGWIGTRDAYVASFKGEGAFSFSTKPNRS